MKIIPSSSISLSLAHVQVLSVSISEGGKKTNKISFLLALQDLTEPQKNKTRVFRSLANHHLSHQLESHCRIFITGDNVKRQKDHSMIWGSLVSSAAFDSGGNLQPEDLRKLDVVVRVRDSVSPLLRTYS